MQHTCLGSSGDILDRKDEIDSRLYAVVVTGLEATQVSYLAHGIFSSLTGLTDYLSYQLYGAES